MTRERNGTGGGQAQGLVAQAALAEKKFEAEAGERIRLYAPFDAGLDFNEANRRAVASELGRLATMHAMVAAEAGRRLLWAQAGWGSPKTFEIWLREHVPFSRRTAYYYMAIARGLDARPRVRAALEGKSAQAILEVLDVDAAELDDLERVGRTGELALEDVDRMTSGQLRQEIRKVRLRNKKGGEQLEAAEERVADLEIELRQRPRRPQADFIAAVGTAHAAMKSLREMLAPLGTEEREWRARLGDLVLAADILAGVERSASKLMAQTRRLAKSPKGQMPKICPPARDLDGDEDDKETESGLGQLL